MSPRKRQHTFQVLTKRPHRAKQYFAQTDLPNRWYQSAKSILWQAFEKDFDGLINLQTYFIDCPYPLPNLWFGVTVENQAMAVKRIPILRQIPAVVKWLSVEPVLGEMQLFNVDGSVAVAMSKLSPKESCLTADIINWVVVGSESGNGARPSPIENIESVVSQCLDADVPVFVKQLGQFPVTFSPDKFPKTELITRKKYSRWCFESATKLGFELEGMHCVKLSDRKGGDISEFPPHLQLRQFPVSLLSAIAPG